MRPRYKVVLLARTDIELSLWRMRLQLAGYEVLGTLSPGEAVSMALATWDVRAAVVQTASNPTIAALQCDGRVKVMVIDGHPAALPKTLAERFLLPDASTPAEVVRQLRLLTERKRGPKKFWPSTANAPQLVASVGGAA
jgi:hypothetical protein